MKCTLDTLYASWYSINFFVIIASWMLANVSIIRHKMENIHSFQTWVVPVQVLFGEIQ
jgi:hypothetical protein